MFNLSVMALVMALVLSPVNGFAARCDRGAPPECFGRGPVGSTYVAPDPSGYELTLRINADSTVNLMSPTLGPPMGVYVYSRTDELHFRVLFFFNGHAQPQSTMEFEIKDDGKTLVELSADAVIREFKRVEALDPQFFANEDFLHRFPGASALHPDSLGFVVARATQTHAEADALVALIQSDPDLAAAVAGFSALSEPQRVKVMKRVFELEIRSFGTTAPELVLDNAASRPAFFEFDPGQPGPGRVILNPKSLFAHTNPHAALLLLIHETRHSYQFQTAFGSPGSAPAASTQAYRAGFSAQRAIFDQGIAVSFCDFLMLNQEYEAFLFGNVVMGSLTEGKVQLKGMGTLASQFVYGQGFKLDLAALARKVGPEALLGEFNEREKAQYLDSRY
jgi:hypothetical protein